MDNLKYDILLFYGDNLFELDLGEDSTFRINGLTLAEAQNLFRLLDAHGVSCQFMPYLENNEAADNWK